MVYYALSAIHGIHTEYGDGNYPEVHIFETRAARDKWVADDVYKNFDWHRVACTAAEAEKWARVRLDSECGTTLTRFAGEWEWRGNWYSRGNALKLYRAYVQSSDYLVYPEVALYHKAAA